MKKIPKYEFYVHNKDTNRAAPLIKSPDRLVKESDEPSYFYLSDAQRKELLRYFVKDSGYYRFIPKDVAPKKAITEMGEETDTLDDLDLVPF